MRHIAVGGGKFKELEELRGPMSAILDTFMAQQKELERYKQQFGPLPSNGGTVGDYVEDEDSDDSDEGSDTEQEL